MRHNPTVFRAVPGESVRPWRGKNGASQGGARGSATTITGWGGRLILATLLITIFEGAVRKWLVGGTPALRYAVYFSKDIVFVCSAFVSFKMSRNTRNALNYFLPISVLCLLIPGLINLPNSTPIGAILSLRSFLVLPLCAYLAANSVRSLTDVDRIIFAVGLCTIAVAVLGGVQYFLPSGHILNRYETGEEKAHIIAQVGHVRATGTFAFITGMAIMAGVGGWAGAYLFLSANGFVRRAFALVVLGCGLACAMVSMSRSAAAAWLLTVVGGVILFRHFKEGLLLIGLLLIGSRLLIASGGEETADPGIQGGLVHRFQTGETTAERLSYELMNFRMGLLEHPFGEGIGTGQIGGNYAEYGRASSGRAYESEMGRLGFEVGILGFFGVLLWRAATIQVMLVTLFTARDPSTRALSAVSLPFFAFLAINHMVYNHTGSSFGWCIAALVFATVRMEEAAVLSLRPANQPFTTSRSRVQASGNRER